MAPLQHLPRPGHFLRTKPSRLLFHRGTSAVTHNLPTIRHHRPRLSHQPHPLLLLLTTHSEYPFPIRIHSPSNSLLPKPNLPQRGPVHLPPPPNLPRPPRTTHLHLLQLRIHTRTTSRWASQQSKTGPLFTCHFSPDITHPHGCGQCRDLSVHLAGAPARRYRRPGVAEG